MKIQTLAGTIVTHERTFTGTITIDPRTGLIATVTEGPITPSNGARGSDVDTTDTLIFPGFGDIHIHAREDASGEQLYKEDFRTTSAAAIHGGVTHVADMPNNIIAPVDDARWLAKRALASAASAVHVTLYAGIGPHTSPLTRNVPYKAFMGPSVGDLFFTSQAELESAIARYAGRNISFHCEDPVILAAHTSAPTHELKRPASAELAATDFALYLTEKYSLTTKLCHFSTGDGLAKIRAAKARGLRVTAEVTPHHLYFDTSHLTPANTLLLQMNPPLRAPADRLALIEALRDGTIDYIATDHAPHTLAEKAIGHSGVPHLDTYAAFTTWLMAAHAFTPEQIARVCAFHPGRFVNDFLPATLGRGFGVIAPGYAASFTLINPTKPTTVTRASLKTKCAWSPFENITFPGSVTHTILRGEVHTP